MIKPRPKPVLKKPLPKPIPTARERLTAADTEQPTTFTPGKVVTSWDATGTRKNLDHRGLVKHLSEDLAHGHLGQFIVIPFKEHYGMVWISTEELVRLIEQKQADHAKRYPHLYNVTIHRGLHGKAKSGLR